MSPGASPVARIRRFSSASFLNKSQLMRDSSLFIAMMILETSRLLCGHSAKTMSIFYPG